MDKETKMREAAPEMYELLLEIINADLLDPEDEFTQSIEAVLAKVNA